MFKKGCCGGKSTGSFVEEEEIMDKRKESAKAEKADSVAVLVEEGREALPKPETQAQSEPMAEKAGYKLTYFNARIGGEMIRLIFHKEEVPFEDVRIDDEDWPNAKAGTKWGKLPVLECDGKEIYSSTAISRFLAKRFGLLGKNDLEAAKCDELVEVCQDLRPVWQKYFFENDSQKEENKQNFLNTLSSHLPKFNAAAEEIEGHFFLGPECSWADIFVANFLNVVEDSIDPNILQDYPALRNMKNAVFEFPQIQKYVESRPETSH